MTLLFNKEKGLFGLFALLFIVTSTAAVTTNKYLLLGLPFALVIFYGGWLNREWIFYALLFSLPISREYHFSAAWAMDLPDEFLMLFTGFLFGAGWLYSPGLIPKKVLQHPLIVFLLLSFLWILVSVLFSTHPLVSVKFLVAKCWYIGAFVIAPLAAFTKKKSIVEASRLLLFSLLLVVLIILFRHGTTGFRFAGINDAVAPFFRNHVNYSAMLACLLPVFVAFHHLEKRKQRKGLLKAIVLLLLAALFFSYARGAWLALLCGALAVGLIQKKWLPAVFFIACGICLVSLFWLKSNDRYLRYAPDYNSTVFHENFSEHLIATYKLKDVSTAERFYRWIAGVRMIKDNWLTGYGPNTFYENYKGYTVPAYKTWVSDNRDHSTVHNYFLLTAIEQGIPALFFLLLLFGAMLYYSQSLYHRITDPFYKTIALTVGVIVTILLVLNWFSDLIETDKLGSLFFLCISTLVMTDINTRHKPG